MGDEIKIITNHQPRLVVDGVNMRDKDREQFDYHDWPAIDNGTDSAEFVRYRGEWYDLGEFLTTVQMLTTNGLKEWHGYASDTFFSGVVVKYTDDGDHVIMGRYYS